MKIAASIAVMSHLSDAQELLQIDTKMSCAEINRAKALILEFGDDLNQLVDESKLTEICLKADMSY